MKREMKMEMKRERARVAQGRGGIYDGGEATMIQRR